VSVQLPATVPAIFDEKCLHRNRHIRRQLLYFGTTGFQNDHNKRAARRRDKLGWRFRAVPGQGACGHVDRVAWFQSAREQTWNPSPVGPVDCDRSFLILCRPLFHFRVRDGHRYNIHVLLRRLQPKRRRHPRVLHEQRTHGLCREQSESVENWRRSRKLNLGKTSRVHKHLLQLIIIISLRYNYRISESTILCFNYFMCLNVEAVTCKKKTVLWRVRC